MTETAQVAYAAYSQSTGGKNFRGEPMPLWEQLPEAIQTAWRAACAAIVTPVESELVWLNSTDDVFRYLFAQCLGNMAGVAYQEFLRTGQVMSVTRIAEAAEKLAEAGVTRLEVRLSSEQCRL